MGQGEALHARVTSAGCREELRIVLAALAEERGWGFHHLARFNDLLSHLPSVTDVVVCEYIDEPTELLPWLMSNFNTRSFQPILLVVPQDNLYRIQQTIAGKTIAVSTLPFQPGELAEKIDTLALHGRWVAEQHLHFKNLQNETTTWEFRSDTPGLLLFVPPAIEEAVMAGWADQAWRLRMELTLQEALANAVEHGNLELASSLKEELDPLTQVDRFTQLMRERMNDETFASRIVRVSCSLKPTEIEISITDQGLGFNYESRVKELAAEDICHGRGIALMKASTDAVTYSEGGRCITFTKYFKK